MSTSPMRLASAICPMRCRRSCRAPCRMCGTGSSRCIAKSYTRCTSFGSTRHRDTRNARGSSATSSANFTRMASWRSMTRWCVSRRTFRSVIRWSTVRGISAISTAITPQRCGTRKVGSPPSRKQCSKGSARTLSISGQPMTARTASPSSFPPAFRTCSPMARRALPSEWRPASRRTMSVSFAPRCPI